MSLENISSALLTSGSGAVAGFAIGYALKKISQNWSKYNKIYIIIYIITK
jgi:uncharacterized membrane protein (Fun14 family)